MKVKKVLSKERAEELVEEVYDSFSIIDLDKLSGEIADAEKANYMSIVEKRLVQGFMLGLLDFNKAEKSLTQKLVKPIQSGETVRETLVYDKKHNARTLVVVANQKGQQLDELDKLESITGVAKKLLYKLEGVDLEIASSVSIAFLS